MKKRFLKQLIKEVISIMEDPDNTTIARRNYHFEHKIAKAIIISNDGKSGFMDDKEGRNHAQIETSIRKFIHSEILSKPTLKPKDINVNGLKFINEVWWYNVQISKFNLTDMYYFDAIGCRIFNHAKFPRISFWVDWDRIEKANILSEISALRHLIAKIGINIENCTFENVHNKVLTYDAFSKKVYKKEPASNKDDEIKKQIASLKIAMHTSDPIEKKKIKSQIKLLSSHLGIKPEEDGDNIADIGSDKYAKAANKAGFNTSAEYNAKRDINEKSIDNP